MTTKTTNNHRDSFPVVGALAGKVAEPTDISRSEKALLSINEGSLYFPIFYHNEEIGGIFIGTGQALFDAIIDTKRGAIGKSHEFLWNGSLLLLTVDGKWSPPSVQPIKEKDLETFHIPSVEDAQLRAQEADRGNHQARRSTGGFQILFQVDRGRGTSRLPARERARQ